MFHLRRAVCGYKEIKAPDLIIQVMSPKGICKIYSLIKFFTMKTILNPQTINGGFYPDFLGRIYCPHPLPVFTEEAVSQERFVTRAASEQGGNARAVFF